MITFIQDGVTVETDLEDLKREEIQEYIDRGREKVSSVKLESITVKNAGDDEVDISYSYAKSEFQRIRRITGYLVGTLDRFNDAKRIEVQDRVTHSLQDDCEDVYVD